MPARIVSGDLFAAEAEVYVNPVNCAGRMGAGLALAFARRWPAIVPPYVRACKDRTLVPGKILFHHTGEKHPAVILSVPTKRHWFDPSTLELVQLAAFAIGRYVEAAGVRSVAVPALGCGLGGLRFDQVKPILLQAFDSLPADMQIFRPQGRK